MLCLGIESSCDECSLALVRDGILLEQVLASQAELHSIFGGVVPELASREHYRHIGPLFDLLGQKSGINPDELDLVAVTRGPGLLGSLLVGTAFAKALALGLNIPLLGINHLHAHLFACGLEHNLVYPALSLLVSGGHTEIHLIEAPDKLIKLGQTIDDAAGEAYDKIGNMLGLKYPAGKQIDILALEADCAPYCLPRPYLDNNSLNFSFSGLKTAASLLIKNNPALTEFTHPLHMRELSRFCASLNQSVSAVLAHKLSLALDQHTQVRSIWLAGGVAANSAVREQIENLASSRNLCFLVPSTHFCTDNAAMTAFLGEILGEMGYFHFLDMEAYPRGRKIPADMQKNTI